MTEYEVYYIRHGEVGERFYFDNYCEAYEFYRESKFIPLDGATLKIKGTRTALWCDLPGWETAPGREAHQAMLAGEVVR